MLTVEGIGKNIEKAIENALLELKAPREDVDIKILSEGGLFKKARVQVSISADCIEKYEKREHKRKIIADEVEPEQEEKKIEKTLEKAEKKEIKTEIKTEKKELKAEKKESKAEKKTEKENKTDKVLDPEEFLKGYFAAMGKEIEITITEDDKYKTFSVTGNDLGEAIGYRGEAYYALNTIFQNVTGKQEKKYLLDIDNYKLKREESLADTARRIAKKVAKTGRYYKLEPMKPAERRIIHTTLQDDDTVTTLSKGTEPHRYVIVFPKEYKDR